LLYDADCYDHHGRLLFRTALHPLRDLRHAIVSGEDGTVPAQTVAAVEFAVVYRVAGKDVGKAVARAHPTGVFVPRLNVCAPEGLL
jgi:hypothetical protein